MSDHLLQVTLYSEGTIRVSGTKPSDLGGMLRSLAAAADAGGINWVGPIQASSTRVDRLTVASMTAREVHEALVRALEDDSETAGASYSRDYAQDLMDALDEELAELRATRD